MTAEDYENIKNIIQNQERGYTATLYGTASAAEYTEECDNLILIDIIKRYGLIKFVKCLSE